MTEATPADQSPPVPGLAQSAAEYAFFLAVRKLAPSWHRLGRLEAMSLGRRYLHDERHSNLVGEESTHPGFERFYRRYLRTILAARGEACFATKNN